MLKLVLRILYLPFLLVKIVFLIIYTIIWIPFGLLNVMSKEDDIDDFDEKIKDFWRDCF